MPHALLLSPDDQVVSAITAVLDEMSVTCERPLDGPSAAKKLSAQSFDLVLVDCENLPAAKLIFDVCRRSQTGTNPVPIAIVDGRAGLPTAFRLGAELILTKPVAKDQARTTIRTAVSRVRKDDPTHTIRPLETPQPEAAYPAFAEAEPETLTHAAAAGVVSSPTHSESVPVAATRPGIARMSSATEEIATVAAVKPKVASAGAVGAKVPTTEMFLPASKSASESPSDDPILADLESEAPTPVFTSYAQLQKRRLGPTIVLFVLLLACFGFYAAWTYQPGFRETAQPLLNRFMAMLSGIPQQTASTQPVPPTPVKAQPPQAATAQPAPDALAVAASGTPSPVASSTSASSPALTNAPAAAPANTAPVAGEKSAAPAPSKSDATSAAAAETELPGEKTAVILSSQGAEKRLVRQVQSVYPADARKSGIEGTVVLKTVVSETGVVDGVRLVEGNPALAAAAIKSVKQWRYRPYVRDGKARPFQTIVLVEFQRP